MNNAMMRVILSLCLLCWGAARAMPPVERLAVEVLAVLPHDPGAFTQGLLHHQGYLYESTGLYGDSSLREVDPASGEVLRQLPLDPAFFGEGLALVEDRLIQLTWREGLALIWRLDDFRLVGAHQYAGEGWGLCFDGEALWMSDGSATLYRRDAHDFSLLAAVEVSLHGRPMMKLNELACVGGHVYANVWRRDRIVRIDTSTGRIDAEIDASALNPLSERPGGREAVLNGIAHDPERDEFYLTGKFWPTMFRVRFVPRPECASLQCMVPVDMGTGD